MPGEAFAVALPPGRFGPDLAARALGCLLDYAAHHARTTGQMPPTISNSPPEP